MSVYGRGPDRRVTSDRRERDRREEDESLARIIAHYDAPFRRMMDERADRRAAERRASGDRRSAS
jgi:hypothetical protein